MRSIRPLADRGLIVQLVGHADCALAACPGAGRNDPGTAADLAKNIVSRLPLVMDADEPRSLVFSLRVTQQGLSVFAERCLVFHAVELTLSDGSRHTARFGATGTLGGVRRSPTPDSYRDCD